MNKISLSVEDDQLSEFLELIGPHVDWMGCKWLRSWIDHEDDHHRRSMWLERGEFYGLELWRYSSDCEDGQPQLTEQAARDAADVARDRLEGYTVQRVNAC